MADRVALADALRQLGMAIVAVADALPDDAPRPDVDAWIPIRACGLPYRTIRTAIRTGELEGRRVGRETRVRRAAVDAWIERQQSARPAARNPEVDDVDGRIDALLATNKLRVVK